MRRVRFVTSVAVVPLLLMVVGQGPDPVVGDFMQGIKKGVHMAGSLLGIETISDVADLVAKGFSRQDIFQKPETNSPLQKQTASMMMMLWKLVGLNGSKLGALVMNALIFVAHVVSSDEISTVDEAN